MMSEEFARGSRPSEDFLRLEGAERCFLLNAQGEQMGSDIMVGGQLASPSDFLRPRVDALGAYWCGPILQADERPFQ
ncbi:hypothetical protein HDG38_006974 [Paraburkholderia sp. WSM4177]|nr:hypothetical protein [Paraburkholderia sp. WSM4177]MBB5488707.1 hypothetical protein [Paraburkholderia sp. WSM4180]